MMLQDDFVRPLNEVEKSDVFAVRLMVIVWKSTMVSLGIPGNLMGKVASGFRFVFRENGFVIRLLSKSNFQKTLENKEVWASLLPHS